MKKLNLLFLFAFLNCMAAIAQYPVITATQHKPIVSAMGTYLVFENVAFPVDTLPGANKVWDFSTLATSSAKTESFDYCLNSDMNCYGAAVANAYYQQADFAKGETLKDGSWQMTFLKTATYDDYGFSNADATNYGVYSPARKSLIYNKKYTDAAVNQTGTFTVNGTTPLDYVYSIIIDAYGSLSLPNGKVYPKVARVKRSLKLSFFGTNYADEVEYVYYDGNREPLMKVFVNNTSSAIDVKYMLDVVPVNIIATNPINVNNYSAEYINVYPNPAKDVLHVNAESGSQYTVTDILGKILIQSTLENDENTINISNLKTGIYQLTVRKNEKISVQKFSVN